MLSLLDIECRFAGWRLEECGYSIEYLPFPIGNLLGMNAKIALTGLPMQLRQRFGSFEGFDDHFGLEGCVVDATS